MGFKVRVQHVTENPELAFTSEVVEFISEFTLLEKLYTCGLDYEFIWTPHNDCKAEIIVYG